MKISPVLIGVLFLSLFPALSFAKTPVWKVTKGDHHLYIGGTIHLLSKQDYPLPSAFEKAFNDAEILIFETDILALSQPETQAKLSAVFTYQNNQTLKSALNDNTYARLSDFLAERQVPIANFARYTPAGVSLTLTVLELQKMGITAEGVDHYFAGRARQASKQTQFLESIDEQVGFLKAFSGLDANTLVNSSLNDLASLETQWQQLLSSWRNGDMAGLEKIAIDKMQSEFPSVYKFLLIDRNQRWITKIKAMLETKDAEFVLVGALHLAGEHSVLKLLMDQGYSVQQLENK